VIGTAAAIRYLGGLDWAMRVHLEHELTQALVAGALARPYLRLIGPSETVDRHPIATLALAGKVSAGEVARLLSDSYGIMCRSGYLCAQPLVTHVAEGEVLRASAYLYNTASEVERFYEALDELASWMGFGALVPSPPGAYGAR
jgi:cysteine desulfurase/selenocysteine lyase